MGVRLVGLLPGRHHPVGHWCGRYTDFMTVLARVDVKSVAHPPVVLDVNAVVLTRGLLLVQGDISICEIAAQMRQVQGLVGVRDSFVARLGLGPFVFDMDQTVGKYKLVDTVSKLGGQSQKGRLGGVEVLQLIKYAVGRSIPSGGFFGQWQNVTGRRRSLSRHDRCSAVRVAQYLGSAVVSSLEAR